MIALFWESVRIALEGLRANKLRSGLTMLGIIIGVAAVIAMVSIGLGVRDKVQRSIASLGSNLLIVVPGATSASGIRFAAGSGTTLTYRDAQAIAREIPEVALVAPSVGRTYQIVYGNRNWITSLQGATPEFLEARNHTLLAGNFLAQRDNDTRARVVVLGKTTVDNLFGDIDPIGQMVRIDKAPFRVIGVLAPKGQSMGSVDQDDLAVIPLFTAQERMMGITHVHSIAVQASGPETIEQVQNDIAALMRLRHRLPPGVPDDFTVRNLTSVAATAEETARTLSLLLGNTAAISLLVGGIGIMNIMLVSVTERTREIGIRKALGATYHNILLQFLVEAVVIGVTGGLIGIVLGVGGAAAISHIAQWNVMLSLPAIFAAFGFSILIGLFFGIYPARKAALLDPIEALRYE